MKMPEIIYISVNEFDMLEVTSNNDNTAVPFIRADTVNGSEITEKNDMYVPGGEANIQMSRPCYDCYYNDQEVEVWPCFACKFS